MKSVLFGILLFPIATIGFAQELNTTYKDPQVPKFILGVDVFSLANPLKQSASISADFRVSPRMTIDASVGYILNAGFIYLLDDEKSYRGPKFRLGTKFYYLKGEKNTWYVGFEAKHDRITHQRWQEVIRQGGQYSEISIVSRKVNTWGGAGRIGRLIYFDRSKKLTLDMYVGLGANHYTVKSDSPTAVQEFDFLSNDNEFILSDGVSVLPTLVYGIYLGYALW